MNALSKYREYYDYPSEDHLFQRVSDGFRKKGSLTAQEFFTIIIWKSNRSKTRIRDGVIKSGKTVTEITRQMHLQTTDEQRVELLLSVDGIGIPVASAILAVCYPDDFTVIDYRAIASIKALRPERHKSIVPNPTAFTKGYIRYVAVCKEIAKEERLSLRDVDRALWGYDFYEGENGLKKLVASLSANKSER